MRWEDSGKLLLAFVLVVGAVIVSSLMSIVPHARETSGPSASGQQTAATGWIGQPFSAAPSGATQVGPETGGRGRYLTSELESATSAPTARGILSSDRYQTPAPLPTEPPVYLLPAQVTLTPERSQAIAARSEESDGSTASSAVPSSWKPLGTGSSLYVTSVSPVRSTAPLHGLLSDAHPVWPFSVTVYNGSDQSAWVMPHSLTFDDGSTKSAFLCTNNWTYTSRGAGGYAPTLTDSPCALLRPHSSTTVYVYAEDGATASTQLAANRLAAPTAIRFVSLPDGSVSTRLPDGVDGSDRVLRITDLLHSYDGADKLLRVSI